MKSALEQIKEKIDELHERANGLEYTASSLQVGLSQLRSDIGGLETGGALSLTNDDMRVVIDVLGARLTTLSQQHGETLRRPMHYQERARALMDIEQEMADKSALRNKFVQALPRISTRL